MIIDAGYDFRDLAWERLQGDDSRERLVVITLSSEMRLHGLHTIDHPRNAHLVTSLDRMLELVDPEWDRYVAAVQPVDRLPGDLEPTDPTEDLVCAELELLGVEFISHVLIGPVSWRASGAMHRFDSYPGLGLPLATVTPAPRRALRSGAVITPLFAPRR
jgi:hypothetical protein